MKPLYKHLLISIFVGGVVFSLFFAAMDHRDEQPFDVWKFIFRALIFGILTGVSNWWLSEYERKQAEKKKRLP